MKPNLALSLSSNGLSILKRSGSSWIFLGQADLADHNFELIMHRLRDDALHQSSGSSAVKLIIPNDYIKYYTIPRPSSVISDEIEQIIKISLVSETPYKLDEIAFDWVTNREKIFVAAVALQTLHEAEQFAIQQGFKPLGNVANPNPDFFIGEVFFGLANGNQAMMQCDTEPVKLKQSILRPNQLPNKVDANGSDVAFKNIGSTDRIKNSLHGLSDKCVTYLSHVNKSRTIEKYFYFRTPHLNFSLMRQALTKFKSILHLPQDVTTLILVTGIIILSATMGIFLFQKSNPFMAEIPVENTGRLEIMTASPKLKLKNDEEVFPFQASVLTKLPSLKSTLSGSITNKQAATQDKGFNVNQQSVSKPTVGKYNKIKTFLAESYSLDLQVYGNYDPQKPNDVVKFPAPTMISQPLLPRQFEFLGSRLQRIYAVSEIWLVNPIRPMFESPEPMINTELRFFEPITIRKNLNTLTPFDDFEPIFRINKHVSGHKPGSSTRNQQTSFTDRHIFEIREKKDHSSVMEVFKSARNREGKNSHYLFSNKNPEDALTFQEHGSIFSKSGRPIVLLPSIKAATIPKISSEATKEITSFYYPEVKQQENTKSKADFTFPVAPKISNKEQPVVDNALAQSPVLKGTPQTINLPSKDSTFSKKKTQNVPVSVLNERSLASGLTSAVEPLKEIIRPKPRPNNIKPIKNDTRVIVQSLRPKVRPEDVTPLKPAEAVLSSQTLLPEEEGDEASVSGRANNSAIETLAGEKATIKNILRIRQIHLLGIYYFGGQRKALVMLRNGKQLMVKIGDLLDGGKVAAIGNRELRYIKSGQNITLEFPG